MGAIAAVDRTALRRTLKGIDKQAGHKIVARARITNEYGETTGRVVRVFTLPASLEHDSEFEFVERQRSLFVFKRLPRHKTRKCGQGQNETRQG